MNSSKPICDNPDSKEYNYKYHELIKYEINGVIKGRGRIVGCALNALPIIGKTYMIEDLSNNLPTSDYPFNTFLCPESGLEKVSDGAFRIE